MAAAIGLQGCATPLEDARTYAYSWTPVDETLVNIVPFHYLRRGDLQDPQRMLAAAKAATERMPLGHRVLFSWDLHRDLAYHPEDVVRRPDGEPAGCRAADGRFIPYRGVWWDHGVEQVRARSEDWFRRYREIGGEIDVLVLDFEQGFFYWSLYYQAEQRYPCGLAAYLDAIERDPRFPELARTLGLDELDRLVQWHRYDDYLRWDAVVRERLADYLDRAVYEPVAHYFPEVKFSNYGYYHQAPSLGLVDINGHDEHRYGAGRHVGTHQSRALYGWLGNLREVALDGLGPYGATPFGAFRYAVNEMRAMTLSSPAPVSPWVPNKEFGDGLLRDSDLYQELIYHVVLSGVDHLLYWNPLSTDSPATPSSNRLLSALLGRVDEVAGGGSGLALFDSLVGWRQPYVLTGALASGRRVWRFTPRLSDGVTLDDVLVSTDPAVFEVEGITIRVPDGRVAVLEPRLSAQGFWIVDRLGPDGR